MTLPSVAAIGQPQAWGYDGSLDDLLFRLAASPNYPMSIVGAVPEAQRVSTERNPEEFISEFGLVFARSDLSGGAGLDFAHRRNAEDSDSVRFWDSSGMNVPTRSPGEQPYVELLPDPQDVTQTGHASGWAYSLGVRQIVLDNGSILRSTHHSTSYPCATATELVRIDDPAGTPTYAYESVTATYSGFVETWKNFARLGSRIYLGLDTLYTGGTLGLWWRPTSQTGTWTQLGTARVTDVWSVKNRLIGTNANDGTLFEIDPSTGSTTAMLTVELPDLSSSQAINTHQMFWSVHDVGPYIMATCWNGYIYAFEDVSGTLTLVGQTAMSPQESALYMAYHPSGVVLFSTYEFTGTALYDRQVNLYSATVDSSNGQLTGVQLLKVFERGPDTLTGHGGAWISPFTISRDTIYFTGKGLQPLTTTEQMYWRVWKYSVATGGLFPLETLGTGASALPPGEIVIIQGQKITTWGPNLFICDSNVADSSIGFIIYPAVDFYTASDKAWLDVTVHFDNVTTGRYILAYVSTDLEALRNESHPSWTQLSGSWGPGDSGAAKQIDLTSRYLLVMLRPVSNDTSVERPRILGVTVRGSVVSDEFVIDLPINVSDRVEPPGRQPFLSPGWGKLVTTQLLSMRGTKVDLELFKPPITATGVVEAIRVDVQQIPQRGSATDVATVRFRGKLT